MLAKNTKWANIWNLLTPLDSMHLAIFLENFLIFFQFLFQIWNTSNSPLIRFFVSTTGFRSNRTSIPVVPVGIPIWTDWTRILNWDLNSSVFLRFLVEPNRYTGTGARRFDSRYRYKKPWSSLSLLFNLYCHPVSGDSLVNRAAIGDKGCGSNDLIFFVESSSSINSGTVGHWGGLQFR
jgi:hypothetical protein